MADICPVHKTGLFLFPGVFGCGFGSRNLFFGVQFQGRSIYGIVLEIQIVTDKEIVSNAFLIIGGSKLFPIEKKVTRIGRSYENDLILQYPQISRRHAEIRYDAGQFEIVDINSTGGTFLNGVKIWQQVLNKGDVITLVNLNLVFGQGRYPDMATVSLYQNPVDRFKANKDTKTLTRHRQK
jgi:pSer/pThr/pTyr-binding forkhead associated (FHA) protein